MKELALTSIAGAAVAALVSGAAGQCPASGGGILTQSLDLLTIDSINTVACGSGGNTTPNGFARCFDLDDEAIAGEITISSVTWAIQQATVDGIDVNVNVYLDADGCDAGANTVGLDVILAGGEATTVDMADQFTTRTTTFAEPIVIPAGCTTWIEIESPDDGTVELFAFRPGGNGTDTDTDGTCDGAGQCGASYLRGPNGECGLTAFVDLAGIGFPCAHLLLSAAYTASARGAECAEIDPCGDPGSGDCCDANGTPGCDFFECCEIICAIEPFCCEVEWDALCAGLVDANCPCCPDCGLGGVCVLATGPDSAADGYLSVGVDELGGHGSWDPGWSDAYNPDGAFGLSNPTFSAVVYFFRNGNGEQQRQALTRLPPLLGLNDDDSVDTPILTPDDGTCTATTSDTNGDGVDDTKNTAFRIVTSAGDVDLLVDLVQSVANPSGPAGGGAVATLTQTYTFTDDTLGTGASFKLAAVGDYDLVWDPDNDFANDSVGTSVNGTGCKAYVYQMDVGEPATAINISTSEDGGVYTGSKNGCDPDGPGPDPAYGFGSDTQLWDGYGLPGSWIDHLADVGTGTNGDSGPGGPGSCSEGFTPDAHIVIQVDVEVPPGGSTTVTFVRTYGAQVPLTCAGGGCPADLDGNGSVGVGDLIILIGAWGAVGDPADLDGSGTVGVGDLIVLIGAWGPCP